MAPNYSYCYAYHALKYNFTQKFVYVLVLCHYSWRVVNPSIYMQLCTFAKLNTIASASNLTVQFIQLRLGSVIKELWLKIFLLFLFFCKYLSSMIPESKSSREVENIQLMGRENSTLEMPLQNSVEARA